MASLTERQARVLARQQAIEAAAKARFDALSPERQAAIKAREKAAADKAAAVAAARAARKKEPKLIVDPPMTILPIDEFGQAAKTRNVGGIMYPTVNPIYNTYGD